MRYSDGSFLKDLQGLIAKAKEENLTQEEIKYVVQKIEEAKSNPDNKLHSYLYILGRGLYGKPIPPTYKKLVEYFLYYPQNPFISAHALNILCQYWKFFNDYVDDLKNFIRGIDWDTSYVVKQMAISRAGIYLKDNNDKELLSLVLDVFEKSNKEDDMEDLNRLVAYRALGTSQGEEECYLPAISSNLLELEKEGLLDLDIIKRAHEMLMAYN